MEKRGRLAIHIILFLLLTILFLGITFHEKIIVSGNAIKDIFQDKTITGNVIANQKITIQNGEFIEQSTGKTFRPVGVNIAFSNPYGAYSLWNFEERININDPLSNVTGNLRQPQSDQIFKDFKNYEFNMIVASYETNLPIQDKNYCTFLNNFINSITSFSQQTPRTKFLILIIGANILIIVILLVIGGVLWWKNRQEKLKNSSHSTFYYDASYTH